MESHPVITILKANLTHFFHVYVYMLFNGNTIEEIELKKFLFKAYIIHHYYSKLDMHR